MEVKGCECVRNAQVYGLEESIRRAKFPMSVDTEALDCELTKGIKALAQSPIGEGHDNYLCGIVVQFDLTFTNKAWIEMERYHHIDIVSSQSSMHRILKFDYGKSYCKYVDSRIIEIMMEKVANYNRVAKMADGVDVRNKEDVLNAMYLEILYSNPAGFLLTAGMTTNYRQLKTIYKQRKNHRLPEWRSFCRWIETLPHAELITGKDPE